VRRGSAGRIVCGRGGVARGRRRAFCGGFFFFFFDDVEARGSMWRGHYYLGRGGGGVVFAPAFWGSYEADEHGGGEEEPLFVLWGMLFWERRGDAMATGALDARSAGAERLRRAMPRRWLELAALRIPLCAGILHSSDDTPLRSAYGSCGVRRARWPRTVERWWDGTARLGRFAGRVDGDVSQSSAVSGCRICS
jgi:hypothetical protein